MESLIVHQQPECGLSNLPLPDSVMSVATAAALTLGVVQMQSADGVESDDLIELAPSSVPSGLRRYVVTGGEGMAGVQTSADSLTMLSIQVPTDIR